MVFIKTVYIYTDGACSGNPGPGGWGAILRYGVTEKEISGSSTSTTNNRMELTAAIEALKALKEPCHVVLTSDSKYLTDAINKKWLDSWANKGFIRGGKPVPNTDLWKELVSLMNMHKVEYVWVHGHNGHPENERCDSLAVAEYMKIKD